MTDKLRRLYLPKSGNYKHQTKRVRWRLSPPWPRATHQTDLQGKWDLWLGQKLEWMFLSDVVYTAHDAKSWEWFSRQRPQLYLYKIYCRVCAVAWQVGQGHIHWAIYLDKEKKKTYCCQDSVFIPSHHVDNILCKSITVIPGDLHEHQ
jgi:hypothetical protein